MIVWSTGINHLETLIRMKQELRMVVPLLVTLALLNSFFSIIFKYEVRGFFFVLEDTSPQPTQDRIECHTSYGVVFLTKYVAVCSLMKDELLRASNYLLPCRMEKHLDSVIPSTILEEKLQVYKYFSQMSVRLSCARCR